MPTRDVKIVPILKSSQNTPRYSYSKMHFSKEGIGISALHQCQRISVAMMRRHVVETSLLNSRRTQSDRWVAVETFYRREELRKEGRDETSLIISLIAKSPVRKSRELGYKSRDDKRWVFVSKFNEATFLAALNTAQGRDLNAVYLKSFIY